MSTLNVVEKVLRERAVPMVVREIVQVAGAELPTRSRTPDTVVARDLAMEIKRNGDTSKFVRTSPGKYTLRELAAAYLADQVVAEPIHVPVPVPAPVPPAREDAISQ